MASSVPIVQLVRTSVLLTEGPRFEPEWEHFILCIFKILILKI